MSRAGAVFAFEGPDGVGKTTLVEAVRKLLVKTKKSVLVVSFPGRSEGTLGAHVYDIHHRPASHEITKLTPDALQVLHVAAHIDTVQSVIRPHVEKGGLVLLDRYWWSTWVYGKLSGVQSPALEKMIALELSYWDLIFPALIFLISRPIEEIHPRDRKSHRERSQEYDRLADSEGMHSKVVRINNSAIVEKTALAIMQAIEAHHARDKKAPPADPDGTDEKQNNRDPSDRSALHLPFETSPNGSAAMIDLPAKTHLTLWAKLAPAKPTVVFDTYWRFATERQAIFFHRFSGQSGPWTNDPILLHYKFTNAYRASDRVSQYLIRQVIYAGSQTHRDLFFRTILFKLFNRIETWEKLESSLGELSAKTFDFAKYDAVLTSIVEAGETLYSGAYIMPSGSAEWRQDRKHRMHLRLLENMLYTRLPERIASARSMQHVFELLKGVPTIGDFLAYQFTTDLNYSTLTTFSEADFVVPGPGAKDGIRKCFSTLGGLTEADLIRFVRDRQEEEFSSRSLQFRSLWGRSLQLIDCQNLFCEISKYARVYHPEVIGTSGRTRIKQQFRPSPKSLIYWYPPKWGLNERIANDLAQGS